MLSSMPVVANDQEVELDKNKWYEKESANVKRILSLAIQRNLPRMTIDQMRSLIRQLDDGEVAVIFLPNDNSCQNQVQCPYLSNR